METGRSYSVISTRATPALRIRPEWSPAMDLVALALRNKQQVAVHRLGWERLLLIPVPGAVTAMCWRPDGKVLAVGLDTGAVRLYLVDNGKLDSSFVIGQGAPVTSLHWAESDPPVRAGTAELARSEAAEDRADRFFDPLPALPDVGRVPSTGRRPPLAAPVRGHGGGGASARSTHAGGVGAGGTGSSSLAAAPHMSASSQYAAVLPPERLDLLAVGSATGSVHLRVFGHYCAGETPAAGGAGAVECLSVHGNLRSVSVARRSSAKDRTLEAQQYASLFLDERQVELRAWALQSRRVSELVKYLSGTVACLQAAWLSGRRVVRRLFAALEGSGGLSPAEELQEFLLTGVPTDAVRSFLGGLALSTIDRARDDVGEAFERLLSLLGSHLLPAAEQLLFRVSDMRGLAMCPTYAEVGWAPDELESTLRCAQAVLVRTERVRGELATARQRVECLLAWLAARTGQLADKSPRYTPSVNTEAVWAAVERDACSDWLFEEFSQRDTAQWHRDNEAVDGLLGPESRPPPAEAEASAAVGRTWTLLGEVSRLQESWSEAASLPERRLSGMLRALPALALGPGRWPSMRWSPKDGRVVLAAALDGGGVGTAGETCVRVMRLDAAEKNAETTFVWSCWRLPDLAKSQAVTDASLYDGETLSVLLNLPQATAELLALDVSPDGGSVWLDGGNLASAEGVAGSALVSKRRTLPGTVATMVSVCPLRAVISVVSRSRRMVILDARADDDADDDDDDECNDDDDDEKGAEHLEDATEDADR